MTQKIGNLLVLKPEIGDIKNASTALFDKCNNGHDILLDLSQVDSLDSGGLGALMNVGLSVKTQNGRQFALCNLTKQVASILHLTHIDQLFSVYESPQTAIDALTSDVKGKGAVLFLGDETLRKQLQDLSNKLLFEAQNNTATPYKYVVAEEKLLNQLPSKQGSLLILAEKGNASKYPGMRVIEVPLSEEEKKELVRALEEGIGENKASNKLSEKYQATLPEKLEQMEQLIASQAFKELKEMAHKLAGSAGTYGYVKAGLICKEMELLLEKTAAPSTAELQELLKKIRFHFNTQFTSGSNLKAQTFLKVSRKAILCLSRDANFLCVLKQAAQKFELELNETDQNVAYDIVIFDDIHHITEIKDHFRQRRDQVKFWLAFEGNNLEEYMRATEAGIDLIITKPFTVSNLENLLKQHLVENTYKVLVVDDDPDITHFISDALSEWGMKVETLSAGTKILETLHQFKPHLLLLDIQLPGYDGWALLKALRSDHRYKHLKIVIITALDITPKGDYDALWHKPLDKATLQKNVYKLAQREAREEKASEISFSHFLPESTFKNLLDTILRAEKKLPSVEDDLVIIGSFDFEKLSSAEQTDFLIFSENLMHRLLPPDGLYGYLGKGRFALFYTSSSPAALDEALHKFLNDSEYQYILPQTASGERLYSTYSILRIHYTHLPESAVELLTFATNAYDTSIAFPSQLAILDY